MSAAEDRLAAGMRTLREVMQIDAEAMVERTGDLGRYVAEFAFADVMSREGLSVRDRELIVVAVLTALGGREPQLRAHMRAAHAAGLSARELEEAVIQTVPYAGFPTGLNALMTLRGLIADGTVSEEGER